MLVVIYLCQLLCPKVSAKYTGYNNFPIVGVRWGLQKSFEEAFYCCLMFSTWDSSAIFTSFESVPWRENRMHSFIVDYWDRPKWLFCGASLSSWNAHTRVLAKPTGVKMSDFLWSNTAYHMKFLWTFSVWISFLHLPMG